MALGLLLAVAFVPLYVAVARLTELSLRSARTDAAVDLGRPIAEHALSGAPGEPAEVATTRLRAQLSEGGISAIAIYEASGERHHAAGRDDLLPVRLTATRNTASVVEDPSSKKLLVVIRDTASARTVGMILELDPTSLPETPLVRLVALYTGVVALTLLLFAYFAMTRLVVQPIDAISRGASRIAGGASQLGVPKSRTEEFAELTESLETMLTKLLANEELLLSKIAELEQRTEELHQAQESIGRAERLASVGRLAAGIAHEIGNPIAAILGFEELLLAGGLDKEEERDFLERMKRETDRVHRVLRDLLDFARTKTASPDSERGETADVLRTIEGVVALVKPQKRLYERTLEIRGASARAMIAEERLQQVLLNLVLNAADASTKLIRVSVEKSPDVVSITIEDDGPGIAKEIEARLFEPFATTKEVGEGTGLGLAVCRGIVERAGGSIRLGPPSSLGGATFVVELRASVPEDVG